MVGNIIARCETILYVRSIQKYTVCISPLAGQFVLSLHETSNPSNRMHVNLSHKIRDTSRSIMDFKKDTNYDRQWCMCEVGNIG
jgi:hypothetical protein